MYLIYLQGNLKYSLVEHEDSNNTGSTNLLLIFIAREVDIVKACGATIVYGSSLPSGWNTFFWYATRDVKQTWKKGWILGTSFQERN